MTEPTTWKDIVLEIVKQAAAIIGAASILLGAIYKWFFKPIRQDQAKQIANQEEMKVKLDGHTTLLRKAARSQGILEGHDKAKKEVKQDLVDVVRTVKTVQKRQGRRDDKP